MKYLFILLFVLLILAGISQATTYYVATGSTACGGSVCSNSNNGTSKTTAWLSVPGMANCTNTCNSATLNAGDSVILRGGDTWANAAFPWTLKFAGSAGNVIYYGVDQTWFAGGSWSRPIFNPGNTPDADSLHRLILLAKSYSTLDNFEITNVSGVPGAGGSATAFDWYDNTETNVTIENMYIHGWTNPVFAIGTGNVAASGTSITNFVPYSYSPSVVTSWPTTYSGLVKVQAIPCCTAISAGNSSPVVTSITGSNPYTISFTESPSNTGAGCTGCVIQIGMDTFLASGGTGGTNTGGVMLNNVIDGSDTAEVQLNPYADCGLSESNNQFCVASGTASWRQPNIWRGNVIQYVENAAVSYCSEWSSNLIQYIRLSTDPTAHTNAIECVDETPSNNFYYNNVERHANNPNPNVPGGQYSVGLFNLLAPNSGFTSYAFNNVTYDTLQNVPWGIYNGGQNCCGSFTFFNNTSDGGPSWTSQNYDITNTCVTSFTACIYENNHLVSNISSSVLSSCGTNCTHTTNLLQSFTTASGQGYTAAQTYAYSPTSGGSTIGAGTNAQSLCTTITGLNAAAGAVVAACLGLPPDQRPGGPELQLVNPVESVLFATQGDLTPCAELQLVSRAIR